MHAAVGIVHSSTDNGTLLKQQQQRRLLHHGVRAADTTHDPMSPYAAAHAASMRDPEAFWAEAASLIHWDRKWDKVRGWMGVCVCKCVYV